MTTVELKKIGHWNINTYVNLLVKTNELIKVNVTVAYHFYEVYIIDPFSVTDVCMHFRHNISTKIPTNPDILKKAVVSLSHAVSTPLC